MAITQDREFLTIAAVRKREGGQVTEYLFNEKQRIFTLRSSVKSAGETANRLEEAFELNRPVLAYLDEKNGTVRKIFSLEAKGLSEFVDARTFVDKPERTRRIDLSKIDPTTFNIVDHYLKVPIFQLCKRIVPSYTSAKNIFEFCAKQSCHLGGPYDIAPCIPFQYVRDGCYARAHKMRWIITRRYRYCCEKVFSFANVGNDRLAVRAYKWGGCCVTWWYHVAPLIRVRVKLRWLGGAHSVVLAMVIDPGMFDKPVLLSTWLAAQENTACSADANVSKYSIQPGSAYAPANYQGTAFTTDPSYTATDTTLNNYKNLVTC